MMGEVGSDGVWADTDRQTRTLATGAGGDSVGLSGVERALCCACAVKRQVAHPHHLGAAAALFETASSR